MLTFQTLNLLIKLLRMRKPIIVKPCNEDNLLEITSYKNLKADKYNDLTIIDDYSKVLSVRKDEFDYLIENHYIYKKFKYIKFTHKGYRFFQISSQAFISFLARSIATPIVVSIITTLITIKLQSP